MLIPKWLFDETRLVVTRFPFASGNEIFSKCFISKLQNFTDGKIRFIKIWNTWKIQFICDNKYKVQYLSCAYYKGVCSCGVDYIGETICYVKVRCNEHESGTYKNSECFKHL